MLKSAFGGLYLAKDAVQRVLSPRTDGSVPRILDLGTGSGREIPSNCRFILGDCNTCLDDPSYEGAYDMIQARCIVAGILDYRKFVQHIWKTLRPGGVFFVIEGRLGFLDEHRQPLPVRDESDPARSDQFKYLDDVPAWLKDMDDAWEDVESQWIYTPIGPWNKLQPVLLMGGHPKELVEKWVQNARKELEELPFKQWAR
ncbi:hypothetical protein FRC00_003588, partial [Tulasnella sp. 408]